MNLLQAIEVVYTYRNKYQTVHALNGVSADFMPGKVYAIIGSSGSGKTTFLSLLAGLDVPTGGTVELDGEDTAKMDRDTYRLEHVSVIYQNFNLFSHLTVLENAAYPLYVRKIARGEADKLAREKLVAVGLKEEQFGRLPNMLSGGEQQRVAIARALINNPRVLLLDEPLGALDLKLRKQMQIELKRLQKKLGITFVYVTHDQEEAMTMSDRIAVMRDGVILQMDAPAKIYDRPNCRFVADFIGESNVISGVVRSAEGEKLSVETPDGMILACGEGFTVGEKICVSVRSEYLNLSATPVEGFTLRGKVKDFIYIGTVIKTAVELKDGQEIKQSRFEQDGTLREGADVYAWWEPHHGVAIHDASEAEVQS